MELGVGRERERERDWASARGDQEREGRKEGGKAGGLCNCSSEFLKRKKKEGGKKTSSNTSRPLFRFRFTLFRLPRQKKLKKTRYASLNPPVLSSGMMFRP